jgi:hypothetical protein
MQDVQQQEEEAEAAALAASAAAAGSGDQAMARDASLPEAVPEQQQEEVRDRSWPKAAIALKSFR